MSAEEHEPVDWSNSRFVTDPPEELFETTWRDAKDSLESAGSRSGFVLLVAHDTGTHYKTHVHISSGSDKVTAPILFGLLEMYMRENLGGSE